MKSDLWWVCVWWARVKVWGVERDSGLGLHTPPWGARGAAALGSNLGAMGSKEHPKRPQKRDE